MNELLLKDNITQITAKAPATLSNLAIGFDILGVALQSPHDQITLKKRPDSKLVIQEIQSPSRLPYNIEKNTATIALRSLLSAFNITIGFDVYINKGIACGSGMGGSAASAVAALTAANGFLAQPVPLQTLLTHASEAEKITSGAAHCDNAAPCLFGGLILCHDATQTIPLPTPSGKLIITKPNISISTRKARKLLPKSVPLDKITQQHFHLANWINALHLQDTIAIASHMVDLIIEPQRQDLWPHYAAIKKIAANAGALTSCMSGSGPAVVSWVAEDKLQTVQNAIEDHCQQQDYQYQIWVSSWSATGAYIEDKPT